VPSEVLADGLTRRYHDTVRDIAQEIDKKAGLYFQPTRYVISPSTDLVGVTVEILRMNITGRLLYA